MISQNQKWSFISRLVASIQIVGLKEGFLSEKSCLLIAAHGAFETGWGLSGKAPTVFNYWNITRGVNDPRPFVYGNDTDGHGNQILQKWRMYLSIDDAVTDYIHFLRDSTWNPHYREAWKKIEAGDSSFVRDLSAGGYFTLAVCKYEDGFNHHLKEVEEIWRTYK